MFSHRRQLSSMPSTPDLTPARQVSRTNRRLARRPIRTLASVGMAAVVLGALGSTATASAASGHPRPATATTTSAPAGTKVIAKLSEFKIVLSRTHLTPGRYTFVTENVGHTVHALEINGPGVADQRTPGFLSPGKTANLTVVLKDGRYDVFCPVGDHKQLGMNLMLTVSGKAAHQTATTAG
jgi:hypothetical protein